MRYGRYLAAAVAIVALMISLRGWASASVAPTANRSPTCAPRPCATTPDGWSLAVTNVQYDAASGASGAAGSVVVQLDATFTNHTGSPRRAVRDELVLEDATGLKHRAATTDTCAAWASAGVTNGARTAALCTAFPAAAGHPQGLTLLWTPQLPAGREYRVAVA